MQGNARPSFSAVAVSVRCEWFHVGFCDRFMGRRHGTEISGEFQGLKFHPPISYHVYKEHRTLEQLARSGISVKLRIKLRREVAHLNPQGQRQAAADDEDLCSFVQHVPP